jgi:hypothetical protein
VELTRRRQQPVFGDPHRDLEDRILVIVDEEEVPKQMETSFLSASSITVLQTVKVCFVSHNK